MLAMMPTGPYSEGGKATRALLATVLGDGGGGLGPNRGIFLIVTITVLSLR